MRRHIVAADPPSPPAAIAVPQVLKMPLRQVHDQAPLLRQPNPGPGTRVPQLEAHRRGPRSVLLGRRSGSGVVGGLLLRLLPNNRKGKGWISAGSGLRQGLGREWEHRDGEPGHDDDGNGGEARDGRGVNTVARGAGVEQSSQRSSVFYRATDTRMLQRDPFGRGVPIEYKLAVH
ncbi:hypothetical protein BHM03_00057347, partial [Ensete ventricosum]